MLDTSDKKKLAVIVALLLIGGLLFLYVYTGGQLFSSLCETVDKRLDTAQKLLDPVKNSRDQIQKEVKERADQIKKNIDTLDDLSVVDRLNKSID
ncbi:MAG: hypothetical protein EOM68_26240 [Spirochaetia bacterium]|nr:hypothetical protein [Spirochaetia bacterium]